MTVEVSDSFGHDTVPTRQATGRNSVRTLSLGLFTCVLLVTVCTLAVSLGYPDIRVVAYGGLACLIVSVPIIRKSFRWVSPWTLVVLATYLGTGLRNVAVWQRGLTNPFVNRLYLRDQGLDLVDRYVGLYLAGLAILTVTYTVQSSRPVTSAPNPKKPQHEFGKRAWLVVAVLACIGATGLYLYIAATGGLDTEFLSAKRSIYMRGASYQGSYGIWRTVNSLAGVAFYLAVALVASSRSKTSGQRGRRALLLLVLFLNACALDFYSSTRAQLAYTIIGAAVLYTLVRGSLPGRVLWVISITGAALMAWLTILRQASQGADITISPTTMIGALTDGLILNRNFAELFKTANIMDAVPEILPYSYGNTILNYLVAFVPRSIWPDKPVIDPGVVIGVTVYGTDGTSIPPGLIAEGYWACGFAGVCAAAIMVGFGLAKIESRYVRSGVPDAGRALVYSYVWFPVGGVAIGGALGNSLMVALISLVTMMVALRASRGQVTKDQNA